MSSVKKKKFPTIADVMNLSEADFAANEAGKLSDLQTRRLQNRRLMWGLATAGALLMLLLGIVSLVVLLGIGAGSDGGIFVVFGFVGFLWTALLWQMPLKWWHANQELQAGDVQQSEGRIRQNMSKVPIGMVQPTKYYIEQGENKFEVSKDVFFTFKNGDPYTLYYTPKTKFLVGAQHIRTDDAFMPEDDTWSDDVDEGYASYASDEPPMRQRQRQR
ncbi:MAG: hypothetical protein RLP44_00630 [Aggregatilineales bacterium]